jgi:heterodisulfide reductase subunit A
MSPGNSEGSSAVLVLGAGIAGMQAALDLAAMEHAVYLVERSPTVGGNMARLDKTFPTNDCSMCMISPRMVECSRHPRIRILTLAELVDLQGEPGRFTARLRQFPRYVDAGACISCGLCVEKCPKKVSNEYNGGLDQRKAIHFVHSQAIPLVPVLDPDTCIYFQKGRCRACEKLCPTQAIRLEDRGQELEVAVGAVILAAGHELALVPQAGEYGHGRYDNVVTNLEYERMLSATGPCGGHPRRPSDGNAPQRIAWIQCVASRDSARNRNFCSSVCCMAAVKQAILTREHHPETSATIFYMDIRAQGKDFDRYVLRARDTYGVRLVRSMLSQIVLNPIQQNLLVEYYDRSSLRHLQEEFDLVVLSAGLKPSASLQPLITRLGLETNPYGFVVSDLDEPTRTSREGVYVCGTLDGPKDIPESVAAASAAAASADSLLAQYRPERRSDRAAPPERGVQDEQPRIGVFVCHCGHNIAGVLPVVELREFASALPGVVVAEDFTFTCSTQTQVRIRELIESHRLNRVVVAACSPRTHEPLFRETLRQAGLNKYLFEMANIRDQCSWVHGSDPEAAAHKARDLIRGAVSRAALLEPLADVATKVTPRALVIGGGLAGMTAALTLADQGLPAVLVEKQARLGGIAREIQRTLEGNSPRRLVEQLASRVASHRNITLLTETTLTEITGGAGRFQATLRQNGATFPVECGAVIVATGAEPYRPTEYLYGQHPGVMTQLELEQKLFTGGESLPETTVMIQCVGSRNEEFPLCSRVCCAGAVKNAIRLIETRPTASVYILYRDVRTFGFKEEYYRRARDLGVTFVEFDQAHPPSVSVKDDRLRVQVFDPAIQGDLELEPEALVLSTGMRPRPEAEHIARLLRLPLTQEGFFLEAHPKLRPLDFATPGLFLCGLAHSPRFVEESLIQAKGAACRAAGLLLQEEMFTTGAVAEVDRDLCSACLVCVRVCPYRVPVIDAEGISAIDPCGCQGCGLCVAECPAKAITLRHSTDSQMTARIAGACAAC